MQHLAASLKGTRGTSWRGKSIIFISKIRCFTTWEYVKVFNWIFLFQVAWGHVYPTIMALSCPSQGLQRFSVWEKEMRWGFGYLTSRHLVWGPLNYFVIHGLLTHGSWFTHKSARWACGLFEILSYCLRLFPQWLSKTSDLTWTDNVMQVVMMADGQGTIGSQILKPNIRKLRSMGKGDVIGGFAGTAYICAAAIAAKCSPLAQIVSHHQ